MMKRLVKISLVLFLFAAAAINCLAAEPVTITVNGSVLKLEDGLVNKNNRIYISLRDIGNAFEYEFNWSQDKKTVNLKNDKVIIALQSDNRWFTKKNRDGKIETYQLPETDTPRTINSKIYVPVGAITLVSGGSVFWDGSRNMFNIIYGSSLEYSSNINVGLYAGTGKKGSKDGALAQSTFNFAQSIYSNNNKEVYVADAGSIRKISKGMVETLKIEPANVKIMMLRGSGNRIYALSSAYQKAKQGKVMTIFKLEDTRLKEIYSTKMETAKIIDFNVLSNTELCMIREDIVDHQRYLDIVGSETGQIKSSLAIEAGFSCIAAGDNKIYLGNSIKGSIYSYDVRTKELRLFAGVDGRHQYADGSSPLFCKPKILKFYNQDLYVFDYNVLRKLTIDKDGNVTASRTIAGKATALINSVFTTGTGKDVGLSSVNPIDFTFLGSSILITDANQFKIMEIK